MNTAPLTPASKDGVPAVVIRAHRLVRSRSDYDPAPLADSARLAERAESSLLDNTQLFGISRSMNTNTEVTPSRILLAAWIAAENALPPASRKLIDDYDEIHRAWGKAGWPKEMPPELATASKAIEEDPMASIAFDLRRKTNHASADEYRKKEAA